MRRRRSIVPVWLFVLTINCSPPTTVLGDDDEPAPDEAAPAQAGVFHAPVQLAAMDGVIDSGAAWGHASPWVEDIDGDGVRDLVVGDFSGLFRFYRNRGTDKEPHYAVAVNLQAGGVDAKVPIY
ncbi:MAG TPA: hypothetical protein VF306_17455 [Pirellulales bacterium]